MSSNSLDNYIKLDPQANLWDRVFTVAPLVLIGSRGDDGRTDIAPKHMVTPIGWGPYFGFVCTPRHATYRNIKRNGTFTVSYPRADQVVLSSLTAAPRCEDDSKPNVEVLDLFEADNENDMFVNGSYLLLECKKHTMLDGFGEESMIIGEITAAYADEAALRTSESDDNEVIEQSKMLTYLPPGRWAEIKTSYSFPFPSGFSQ